MVLGVPAAMADTLQVVDFESTTRGQNVDGLVKVNPSLNISTSGGQTRAVVEGVGPGAYGQNMGILNACLGNPGEFDTDGGSLDGKGISDFSKAHRYEFSFVPGMSVNEFSIQMLDFGDYNPTRAT